MKSNTGFGICLLKQGQESGKSNVQQSVHSTGTYVEIVDWDQLENGLLGITVEGAKKFSVIDCWQGETGLLQADVTFSKSEIMGGELIPIEDEFTALAELLQNLESHPMIEKKNLQIDYDNLWDLGWRLSDLIPIEVEEKQRLLELDDPWDRIESIEQLVSDLSNEE